MSDETSGRPLPEITEENEFFWTSGADGRLRLTECGSCAALLHPPQPVCRYCHGHETGVRAVSGFATLTGFTVNHRFGLPGLPPPYVVAQVAIEEDPRVRLTTNAVQCDPEQLELGMRMEVVFEQVEDTWLPLFRPAAEQGPPAPLPSDEVPPDQLRSRVRPMATTEKFEDKVAISGIGSSRIGRRLMVPPLSLTVEACEQAVTDAGLTIDDIDGLATYPGAGAYGGFAEGGVTALEAALGLRPTWHHGGGETFGPGGSLIAAMLAVAGGLARHVLCFRTVWEATYTELIRRGRIRPQGNSRTAAGWLKPFGAISAAHPGPERAAALPPLRDHARDARLDRAQPAGERRAQPDGHLPRPDDHGRLPERQARHHTLRAVRLRCALRRSGRRDRVGGGRGPRPGQAARPGGGGRHPDPGTDRVGPEHAHPRTAGARPVRPPLVAYVAEARRRRRGRALRRIHLQLPFLDRGVGLLRDRRGQGLPRRRKEHRQRWRAAAQHPRRPALPRPYPWHGPGPRGGHAAARGGRRATGARREGRRGQQRGAHPSGVLLLRADA